VNRELVGQAFLLAAKIYYRGKQQRLPYRTEHPASRVQYRELPIVDSESRPQIADNK